MSRMNQLQIDEHLNFIVHNYISASRFLPAPGPKTTIEAGRYAIASATLSDGWSSVNWDFNGLTYSMYPLFYPVQ